MKPSGKHATPAAVIPDREPAGDGLETGVHNKIMWVMGIVITGIAVFTSVMFFSKTRAFRGAVIDPPLPAADIRLLDFDGNRFELSSLRGKVVVLFFGYTNCPDECPLTLAHLKLALELIGDKASDVRVVLITTDPVRDTPEVLKDYLGRFRSDFVGLLGSPEQLTQVWKDYGVTVENQGETHSGFVYVIDKEGNFRETFRSESPPEDLAADILILLHD